MDVSALSRLLVLLEAVETWEACGTHPQQISSARYLIQYCLKTLCYRAVPLLSNNFKLATPFF